MFRSVHKRDKARRQPSYDRRGSPDIRNDRSTERAVPGEYGRARKRGGDPEIADSVVTFKGSSNAKLKPFVPSINQMTAPSSRREDAGRQ